MATEKKTFLFNGKNGVMVANLTDTLKQTPDIMNNLDLTKFKVKEVEFDNTTHYWEGDHDTGSIKPNHNRRIITEREVKYAANLRVVEKFPIHQQLNTIIEMLDASDIPNTPKFNELKTLIKEVKEETKEQKKVYEEDDAYELVKLVDEVAKADKVKDL